MKNNEKKAKQLKMPYGTANAILRKAVLFKYICKCVDNFCYQCGAEIKSVDDLSIEHKAPYLDTADPIHHFFDLDNIAFSHLSCNVSAARRHRKDHGGAAYKRGCRCEICRETNTRYTRNVRAKKKLKENYEVSETVVNPAIR